jgi:hypothetical protein
VSLNESLRQLYIPRREDKNTNIVVRGDSLAIDRAANAFRFECLSVREAKSRQPPPRGTE